MLYVLCNQDRGAILAIAAARGDAPLSQLELVQRFKGQHAAKDVW